MYFYFHSYYGWNWDSSIWSFDFSWKSKWDALAKHVRERKRARTIISLYQAEVGSSRGRSPPLTK